MKQEYTGGLMVLGSAAGFATLGIFIKLAYAAGANSLTIMTFRFLLAAIFLWLALKPLGISARIDNKLAFKLFLMGGLGYGTGALFFTLSLDYLPAALTEMLLFTYPALVAILSFIVKDDEFSWYKGLSLLICFFGLFLILGVSFNNIDLTGVLYALASAIIYSIYVIIGNRVLKDVHSLVATTYVCSAAAFIYCIIGTATDSILINLPANGWLALLGIAIPGTIVGILGFFAGMSRIGGANAAIISTAEPVINVVLCALILGEQLTLQQVFGGLLIVASIVVLELYKNKATSIAA